MKLSFPKSGRLLAIAAILLTPTLNTAANEPGVVILYADGTEHSRTFSDINKLEIGSDAVVLVHSAGSESHKMADIDRIYIGVETTGVSKLPAEATLAVWPTVAAENINVLAAEDCTVNIYDLGGRLVAGPFEVKAGDTLTADITACPAGYLLLQAGNQTVKFIKN